MTTTTRMSREDRRAQLLAIGRDLVTATSFEELSLDEVTARAGISRSLLFHYFPSRSALLAEIVAEAARGLLDVVLPADGSTVTDPMVALREGLSGYVDHISENRAAYIAIVRGAAGGDEHMREVSERVKSTITERVLTIAGDLGWPLAPAAPLAVRGCLAFVEETAIAWLEQDLVSRAELIDLIEQVLAAAILSPAAEA